MGYFGMGCTRVVTILSRKTNILRFDATQESSETGSLRGGTKTHYIGFVYSGEGLGEEGTLKEQEEGKTTLSGEVVSDISLRTTLPQGGRTSGHIYSGLQTK